MDKFKHLLTVPLLLTLVACSNGNDGEDTTDNEPDQEEVSEETTEEAAETDESADTEEAAEPVNQGEFNDAALQDHLASQTPVEVADLPLESDNLLIYGSRVDEPLVSEAIEEGVLTYISFVYVSGDQVTVVYTSTTEEALDSVVIGSSDFDQTLSHHDLDDFHVTDNEIQVLTTGESFTFDHDGTTITDSLGNQYQLYDLAIDDFLNE